MDVLILGTVPSGLLAAAVLSPARAAPGAGPDTGVLADVWVVLGLAMPLWVCWRFVASMPSVEPLALGSLTGHRVVRVVLRAVTTVVVLLVALLVTGGAVTLAVLAGGVVRPLAGEDPAGQWLVAAVGVVVLVAVAVLLNRADDLLRSRADGAARDPAGPPEPAPTDRCLPWYDLAVPVALGLSAVIVALVMDAAVVPPAADALVVAVVALLVAASWACWRAAAPLPHHPPPS